MWSSLALRWFQEPTKNKIGNGRNGGKENLGSNDEVGYTSVILTESSNIIETWNVWAVAKYSLTVWSQEHGSASVTCGLNLTFDKVNFHREHTVLR